MIVVRSKTYAYLISHHLSRSSLAYNAHTLKDGMEEEGDYLDIDLFEYHIEDFRDITTILKLSDTTKDKLTFSVSCTCKCMYSCSLGGGGCFGC